MFDLQTFFSDFFKMPELPNQKAMEKVCLDMAVHTRKRLPEELLLARRPNEEEHIYNYRLKNYEPITYGSMNKALDELFRIVNGIDFKLNVPDSLKPYLEGANFQMYSFVMFFQKEILKRVIEDPNGLIAWIPTGEGVTDGSKKVLPKPYLVYCGDIRYHDENVCAFLSDEKSPVLYNKKKVYEGEVYWILTTDAFYKLIQKGRKQDRDFVIQLVYEHPIGEIPVVKLGGDKTANEYYESFFAPYLAFGNEAIRQFSDWQAIMTTSSFPYIEEFGIECEIEQPRKQSKPIPEGEETHTGGETRYERPVTQLRVIPKSPYGTTLRKVNSKMEDNWEAVLPPEIPSRRFIHPDINIAKYSGEAWDMLINKAEDALHLNLGDGLISGKAKIIDKESQTSLITKIGNNFFDIQTKSLKFVEAYYNHHAIDASISIDRPDTFEVKTQDDLVQEISTLKEKKVPAFFLQEATRDLAKKRFSGNKLSQKIFEVITILDPLYIYDIAEKEASVMGNNITKEAYIKSLYIYSILLKIAYTVTPDAFIKMDLDKISQLLEKELQPLYAAIKPTPAAPTIL